MTAARTRTFTARRIAPWFTAMAMTLLAGCAVYPDEVSDSGYYGGGGGYYDDAYYGGAYYYPGHYYSYYPGYYAYCPPVYVPGAYYSYWRQHRRWPDGWHGGGPGRDHGGWHGRPGRDHDHDHDHAGNNPGPGAPGEANYRGKPNSPSMEQAGHYRMPNLANNPRQVRGQFNRASAAARMGPSVMPSGEAPRGHMRGGDRQRSGAATRGEARGKSSYRGSSSGQGGDGGSYRGSGGGSGGSGYTGSGGGNYRGGGRGR